jgi:hypothetical protein
VNRSRVLFGCLAGLLSAGCGSKDGPTDGGGGTTTPPPPPPLTTQSIDCTASSGRCPQLVIANDPLPLLQDGRTSPARGNADPSMRRDPGSNTIWVAYSWPSVQFGLVGSTIESGITVASHLGRSDDNGATWLFARRLWLPVDTVDETGVRGWLNSEVVSLAPRTGGQWYSVRLRYFVAPGIAPRLNSFMLHVATASSPELLSDAQESKLGGGLTVAHWRPNTNLASLSAEVAGCTWNDPGIIFRDGNLYLAVQCTMFVGGVEAPDREFVAMFATQPTGDVRTWTWRYLGRLAGITEARELGGETLLQTDLALGQDGQLLAIFSPSRPNTPLADHFGCRVVEVTSLDPPRLARDNAGRLRVRASITATDLLPGGPGACAYDPTSASGVVIVRRVQSGNELVVTPHRSGIRP